MLPEGEMEGLAEGDTDTDAEGLLEGLADGEIEGECEGEILGEVAVVVSYHSTKYKSSSSPIPKTTQLLSFSLKPTPLAYWSLSPCALVR